MALEWAKGPAGKPFGPYLLHPLFDEVETRHGGRRRTAPAGGACEHAANRDRVPGPWIKETCHPFASLSIALLGLASNTYTI